MFIIKIMAIVALATVIYVLLYAMQMKHIGYLVILLAAFSITGILVETVLPVVNRVESKIQEVDDRIKRIEQLPGKLLPDEGKYETDSDGFVR